MKKAGYPISRCKLNQFFEGSELSSILRFELLYICYNIKCKGTLLYCNSPIGCNITQVDKGKLFDGLFE